MMFRKMLPVGRCGQFLMLSWYVAPLPPETNDHGFLPDFSRCFVCHYHSSYEGCVAMAYHRNNFSNRDCDCKSLLVENGRKSRRSCEYAGDDNSGNSSHARCVGSTGSLGVVVVGRRRLLLRSINLRRRTENRTPVLTLYQHRIQYRDVGFSTPIGRWGTQHLCVSASYYSRTCQGSAVFISIGDGTLC